MRKIIFLSLVLFWAGLVWAAPKGEKTVHLKTPDGWTIVGVYHEADPASRTVLLLHDVGQNKERFEAFCNRLSAQGIGYLAIDLRGHGQSTNLGKYTSFAKEGIDNGYNKMTRDVNSAVEFLKEKGVWEDDIVIIGVGMGANVAAKTASLWPEINGIALLTPVANFRDVLPIPALRAYKGNVFIAAASDDKKTFLEASVMRNVSFLSSGEGKVTFATAYDKKGHELLDSWVTPELLQWIKTPQKPALLPDIVEEEQPDATYEPIAASGTEEALFPSVLN